MTMEALISGLQNQNLRIPAEQLENLRRFTMTGTEGGRNRDDIPFDRYVDVWWNALCVGIQEGRRTQVDPQNWHNFVRAGEVLPSNPWRLFQLQLLAIGETGTTDVLSKPGELITLANEYAATGLPMLLNELLGRQVPIWAMTKFVEKRLSAT